MVHRSHLGTFKAAYIEKAHITIFQFSSMETRSFSSPPEGLKQENAKIVRIVMNSANLHLAYIPFSSCSLPCEVSQI